MTMINRRGLLVPSHLDAPPTTEPITEPGDDPPGPPVAPTDGYTDRVRELEAATAEADRIRALPTGRVLARRQALAEAEALAALEAEEHARLLAAAGGRERAELAALAASAAAKRTLESAVTPPSPLVTDRLGSTGAGDGVHLRQRAALRRGGRTGVVTDLAGRLGRGPPALRPGHRLAVGAR
jgi:hypothetical protein